MPRDLHAIANEDGLQGMPRLTKSPEEVEGTPEHPTSAQKPSLDPDHPTGAMDAVNEQGNFQTPGLSKRDDLHPYTQSLSINDIDSCTKLEEETFPPNERATREKVSLHVIFLAPYRCPTQNAHATLLSTCWRHTPSLHAFSAFRKGICLLLIQST